MSAETYGDLHEEIHRYFVPGIRDDDPFTIILDSDGSQIPMGTIYGMEIYVDKRISGKLIYMEQKMAGEILKGEENNDKNRNEYAPHSP